LSLAQVAERSGVAKATLYKLERGFTNPTLDTLSAIAESLLVEVEDLIALPTRPPVEIVRAGEGRDISDDESIGWIVASTAISAGTLEIHSQKFHAGAASTSVSHGQGAREHVLVRKGSVVVGPLGQEERIEAGDYATYAADVPHVWRVASKAPADVWILLTFPRHDG
jgi:transcriptional regulator with XRE-family HTH domain